MTVTITITVMGIFLTNAVCVAGNDAPFPGCTEVARQTRYFSPYVSRTTLAGNLGCIL